MNVVHVGVLQCEMHSPNMHMHQFYVHVTQQPELTPFLLENANSNTNT